MFSIFISISNCINNIVDMNNIEKIQSCVNPGLLIFLCQTLLAEVLQTVKEEFKNLLHNRILKEFFQAFETFNLDSLRSMFRFELIDFSLSLGNVVLDCSLRSFDFRHSVSKVFTVEDVNLLVEGDDFVLKGVDLFLSHF